MNLWWICRESVVNLSWACPRCQQLFPVWRIKSMKIMKIGLKWVHMARYELILRLDGALWLTIISKPPLTPRRAIRIENRQKNCFFFLQGRTPPSEVTKGHWGYMWEAYISPPPPKSKPGPGPGNPDVLAKTKTVVFWHIVEISARYYRQIDRTDVVHLFCFQEIMKNWPRGQKRGPWLQKSFA